ncbi:uncharacterized protein LOC116160867 [Photinus pyralis]|uniref:uncharacterized protein LOC116160867 n=1 Tax=Photinus pyralis TaxID=7054 RepID=UPI001267604C|nr:uncharacterized protein LOC116160867 [Photinus pyralis]
MPGRRCAVFGCNNSRISTKDTEPEIIYHNFPKKSDDSIRKEWIRRCKRVMNPSTSQMCSAHFTAEDYERDMRNELLGLPLQKRLRKNSVPTLNLPESSKETTHSLARKERSLKKQEERQRIEEMNELIDEPLATLPILNEQSTAATHPHES